MCWVEISQVALFCSFPLPFTVQFHPWCSTRISPENLTRSALPLMLTRQLTYNYAVLFFTISDPYRQQRLTVQIRCGLQGEVFISLQKQLHSRLGLHRTWRLSATGLDLRSDDRIFWLNRAVPLWTQEMQSKYLAISRNPFIPESSLFVS
jgi:hypothetical protein